jgi:RNA polymerase sigma factor (sigma-70 family)
MGRPRTPSPLLLLPPNLTCDLTPEEENALARQIALLDDEGASTKLYNCCLGMMFRIFYRKTWGDIPETEDLINETLMRAWEELRKGSWSGEAFRPWLFGIARNVFREWLRAKPKQSDSTDRNGSSPSDNVEQIDQADLFDEVLIKDILWRLVAELPAQDRLVLLLRYYRGLRYAEMAPLLECSEKACKERHYRAMKRLRAKIRQADFEEELGFGKGKQRQM